ncbi:MAG: NUDIX hydrolase [Planctomycetota bacterium]|jgi:ADP-ribose pyrophosphatase
MEEDAPKFESLERRTLHTGRVFRVEHEHLRLPSGLEQRLDLVVHPGAVCVLAETRPGYALAVRQYRHAVETHLLEIPAGRLEPGEDPLVAARRELEEETGHRAARWTPVFDFVPAPGFCSERLFLFLAQELSPAGSDRLAPDEDEELEAREVPVDALLETRPIDAKTWMAASWYLHHRR